MLRLESAPLTESEVELRWTGSRPGKYDVFTDGGIGLGVFWRKARVQGNFYRDSGLEPDATYSYFVRPQRGERSRETTVQTLHSPPPLAQIPTSQPIAAAYPSPHAATPRPSVTPSPVPADTILLGLMSSTDYVDDLGELVVVGIVRNDANSNAADARVTLTLYNAAGSIIGEIGGRTLVNVLKPGQRSPFIVSVPRPDDLWEWSLRATARPTTEQPHGGLTMINSHAYEDQAGFYHVTGTVINGGSRATRLAQVVVTLYDKWGKIVNAGFAYTDPSSVRIGSEATFDCPFSYFPRVSDFTVQLEWD